MEAEKRLLEALQVVAENLYALENVFGDEVTPKFLTAIYRTLGEEQLDGIIRLLQDANNPDYRSPK